MRDGRIITVTGEIPAESLGATLAHEHLYCDISPHSGKADNVVTDAPLITRELAPMLRAGGRSVIEVTTVGIGRDPVKLREIASASGVQVVSGVAFYQESTY